MKTLKKSIVLASIASALFSSCKQSQMLPLSLTGHNGLKISSVSLSGLNGEVKIKIKNPNTEDVKLFRSDLDIKLNDIPIGIAKVKKRTVIPANSEVEEVLYLKTDFSKMGYSDVPKIIKMVRNKNVTLSVNGNLKNGRTFNKTLTPVEIRDTVNMEEKTKPIVAFLSEAGKKTVKFFSKKKCEE